MKKKLLSIVSAAFFGTVLLTGCSVSQTTASESENDTDSDSEPAESESSGEESALLTELKDKGYITIATSNDAPFCYYDVDTNELTGLDVDILQEICNRLGIPEIKANVTDFSNMLIELNNKNVDMVADAMYITDERLQQDLFTDVWYTEGEAVVTKTDSEFTTKESLKDASVGAQPGTAFYELAQQWAQDGTVKEVVSYENQATLMTAVNTGKVDAAVTDGIVAAYTLSQDSSLDLKLMSPYEAEATGRIGAAVRFEDKDFLEEVNGALNDLKEDGTLMKILENYGLSEDYFIGVDEGKTENVQ